MKYNQLFRKSESYRDICCNSAFAVTLDLFPLHLLKDFRVCVNTKKCYSLKNIRFPFNGRLN